MSRFHDQYADLNNWRFQLIEEFERIETIRKEIDWAYHRCMHLLLTHTVQPDASEVLATVMRARQDLKRMAPVTGEGWNGLSIHPFVEQYLRPVAVMADPAAQHDEWLKHGYRNGLTNLLNAIMFLGAVYYGLRWVANSPQEIMQDSDATWILRLFKLRE